MDHNHILNTIVQALHTSRAVDVEMGALQNNPHQDRNKGGTATIEKDRTALMQCPSDLFAPTLMGHFYSLNAILQPPHTTRR